jgi:hypothetical protein
MNPNDVDRYATVNDLKMYYEIHGTGHPIILCSPALATIVTTFLDAPMPAPS